MIRNTLKIVLIAVLFIGLFSVGTSRASAAALSFSADTTISIGSNSYTIASGSEATSIVVGASTLTVVVPTSSTFTFSSTDRVTLTSDIGVTQQCTSTASTLVITGSATAVITPNTSAICTGGGGGGVSSGGGGGTVAPDTTAPTATSVSINAGAATTATRAVVLTVAATDATQMIFSNSTSWANSSWLPYSTSQNWMLSEGDETKTVYAKFSDAAGNISTPVSDTIALSGSGTVASTTPPATPPANNTTPPPPTGNVTPPANNGTTPPGAMMFAKSLSLGAKGTDVLVLQAFLVKNGFLVMPKGVSMGSFGSLTKKAIQAFQVKYGIAKAGDTGYGSFGPKTRAKAESMK